MIKVNLDDLMKKRKVSSKDMARKIGITQANFSILKNSKGKAIRFETLNTICEVLKCTPGDILIYTEDEDY